MKPRGFTLIEITVALIIGGMALSAAAALLTGLGERADQIRNAANRVDRDGNAERMIRSLFENLRAGTDTSHRLNGDSVAVTFYTRCETVEGWLRPCSAVIAVDSTGSGFQVRLTQQPEQTQVFELSGADRGPAVIRYLKNSETGGKWDRSWAEIVPPMAVQLIHAPDTLLFPIW